MSKSASERPKAEGSRAAAKKTSRDQATAAEKPAAAAPEKKPGKNGGPDLDRRSLADKYMPFVRSIAGKVKKTVAKEIDFEDLVEYGMIGLFEAADRYEIGRAHV